MAAVVTDHTLISKGWGFEKWITNNSLYCGKLLYFVKGKKCSWHYHEKKDEVLYIHSGRVLLKYSTEDNIESANEVIMSKGDSFRVSPLLRHQMIALEDTELFEFSTTHFDEDSIRIEKGD
jgi:mannose-6-phosphate isomerase-like protein (cupin superfamily)